MENGEPPKYSNYIGRRRVTPNKQFLTDVYEECMKYREDSCRFFFLAIDWVYRVSEIINSDPTTVKTIVSMCRRLFNLSVDADGELIDEEVRRKIILLLDGMLVIEPMYRHVKSDNDIFLFWEKHILPSIVEDQSEYYNYDITVSSLNKIQRTPDQYINVTMSQLV
jgi:hypothetical protein